MKISSEFSVKRLKKGVFLVSRNGQSLIHLDFRNYASKNIPNEPHLFQHYMARPLDARTIAFYEPITDEYRIFDLHDDETIELYPSRIAMLRSGLSRPTLTQPEYVNVLFGLTLEDLM